MSMLSDYYDAVMDTDNILDLSAYGALKNLYSVYEKQYERSHGAERYKLSQIPGFGDWKRFQDTAKYWQDHYDNTGVDPLYSGQYGSAGLPVITNVAHNASPMRMVGQLSKMYGCEVELKLERQKTATANAWYKYERLKQMRWIYGH